MRGIAAILSDCHGVVDLPMEWARQECAARMWWVVAWWHWAAIVENL
jgi:hypothetical protein